MLTLANMYHPITASPFQNSDSYSELPPCEALKPYIRCFWGTKAPITSKPNNEQDLVIPDTCMDIIFKLNYTNNHCSGYFCTVDEHSHLTGGDSSADTISTFAIRFYAWAAILFTEQELSGTKNKAFSVEHFFEKLRAELEPMLFDIPTLYGKAEVAEGFLLKRLNGNRINTDLMNSVYYMINSCGRAKISEICAYSAISERQLERIFNYNMGISPKSFSSLIRYQLLWQDMVLSKHFNALDAVEKYGYTDQSHLLNDFKKHHMMSPCQALEFAKCSK